MIIVPVLPAGGYTLCDYQGLTRELLHDVNIRQYSDAQITKWVNIARNRTARDTLCVRLLQTGLTITAGVEQYPIATFLPFGTATVGVLGISVYWGNLKYQLRDWTYRRLDTWLRTWNTFRQRPLAFARYGAVSIYVGPNPDQNYITDWDTCVTPNPLVDCATPEQIPIPFQDVVPFFAAHYGMMYSQNATRAADFLQQYEMMRLNAQGTWRRQMNDNPYAR